MVFASRSNRCLRAASEENCAGKILIATVRPRRVSRARYTSPIPPAPSGETISYGPSLAPRVSVTVVKLYLPKQNAALVFTDARRRRMHAMPRATLIWTGTRDNHMGGSVARAPHVHRHVIRIRSAFASPQIIDKRRVV